MWDKYHMPLDRRIVTDQIMRKRKTENWKRETGSSQGTD